MIRRQVAERLMESNWIVKGFKVSEHGEPGLLEVGVVLELGPFMLQWPEESFGNGIIVTTTGAIHRAGDLQGLKHRLIGPTALGSRSMNLPAFGSSQRARK